METKRLTTLDATLLVMGGIIGVGIFFKPGEVAGILPSQGAYFSAWGLGTLAALAGAMTFAELAAMLPREGGWFEFLREGIGRLPAFLFAWVVLLVISTGASAGVAEFCAEQLAEVLAWKAGPTELRLMAAAVIAGVTLMGCLGIKRAALLQNLCMGAKLLSILVLVLTGLALTAPAAADPTPITIDTGISLGSGLVRASLPVLFTFGGWQLVTYIAPSIDNPQRALPRAIVGGILGVGVVYGLLNLAYVRVLGMERLGSEPNVAAALAEATLGASGGRFLSAAMAVSALGFLIATLIATPSIYVAMARQRLFFATTGRLHPRTGAPTRALVLQALICFVYLSWSGDVKSDLGDAVVFAEWIFHGLAAVALLHLAHKGRARPFKSPLYPLFPMLYLLIAAGVVVGNLVTTEARITLLGLGVLALGGVVYWLWAPKDAPTLK
ncbi:MAG: hypothetical protein CMJ86_01730 [Planctomycetes bacterium]|nr:hypothetical protein [Planctomycetota bacterium]